MVAGQLGVAGSLIARLPDVDVTRGCGVIDGQTKCLWTHDCKRVTISYESGVTAARASTARDPHCPPPQPPKES